MRSQTPGSSLTRQLALTWCGSLTAALLVLSTPGFAEEATATETAAAAPSPERAAVLGSLESLQPDPVPRDPRAMGPDEWLEMRTDNGPFSVLYRAPAQAQASGAVLLISDRRGGAHSAARSAQLRPGLARLGFHTYLLGLNYRPDNAVEDSSRTPGAKQIADRVDAVIAHMRAAHGSESGTGTAFTSLVVSEGSAGRWVTELQPQGIDGLVFVDTPTPHRRADNWLLKPTLPVLMVQTAPYSWPPEQSLGATTELHLLPRQPLRAGGGLVLRTVRGWVKRLSSSAASKRS